MSARFRSLVACAPRLVVAAHVTATLTLLTACSAHTAPSGSVELWISGEAAATDGFLYPKGSEVTFADGWEVRFSHVLVTVADVTLSENPDQAPGDQSQTGPAVAALAGAWAIDLSVPGSAPAAGGAGLATPLGVLANQNLRGGAEFESDERYAFGYRIVAARGDAQRVNFAAGDAAEALYSRMIERGYAVLYAGTATFRGEACTSSDPAYDFAALPATVPFELGFATPTTYLNCQNQENQGDAFEGEEYQRGVAVPVNRAALAQITLHLEHPFFADTVHDSPVFFDQLAAALGPADVLETESFAALDPTAFVDASGRPLPWRVCSAGVGLPTGKQRGFGVGHVLVDRAGDARDAFRDYRDYVSYLQSTEGHLNGGEGLCFVQRAYPSPL
jgi:hypothetical protein